MSNVQKILSLIAVTKNDGDQLIVAEDRRTDPAELLPGDDLTGQARAHATPFKPRASVVIVLH
jgi:hypothetical protein